MNYAEKKRLRVMAAKNDETIEEIVLLHSRREALLKASSIARSILARAKSCGEAYRLRKAAEQMKDAADRMGEEMVSKWMGEYGEDCGLR